MGLDKRALGWRSPALPCAPGTCVHCGAATEAPTGLACARCLGALETRRRVAEGFLSVPCPTCRANPFFACLEDLPHGIHASRIAAALRGTP